MPRLLPASHRVGSSSSGRGSSSSVCVLKLSPLDEVLSTLPLPENALQVLQQVESLTAVATNTVQESIQELPEAVLYGILALPLVALVSVLAPSFQAAPVRSEAEMYPEQKAATAELSTVRLPFEVFGDTAFVRPLLKQTQLEYRPLQVIYNANSDGYDARAFHKKVDGKGACIVLAKADGQWFGAYNPRGWASLGGSRPSVAAFLFYKKGGSWKKLRVKGRGGNACSNDVFDKGIYMGADGLVIPLDGQGSAARSVASRLGAYYDTRDDGKGQTILPRIAQDTRLDELKVLAGVYAIGEDIPNSGGVLDLGLY